MTSILQESWTSDSLKRKMMDKSVGVTVEEIVEHF